MLKYLHGSPISGRFNLRYKIELWPIYTNKSINISVNAYCHKEFTRIHKSFFELSSDCRFQKLTTSYLLTGRGAGGAAGEDLGVPKMMNRFLLGGAASALAIVCAFEAQAQDTSAQIRGVVTGANGQPIGGARVQIIHLPTGTSSTVTTSSNGVYFDSGLRVGGPYSIVVGADGYQMETLDGLRLSPVGTETFNVNLAALAETDTITVVGRTIGRQDLNNGVGSSFTAADLANQPNADRTLEGLLQRDPLANVSGDGAISIGGFNPRFTSLAIDGSLQSDDFGLSNRFQASLRPPVSLDAIESISVVASDYSVINSGFRGGLVNITTKSGTNEFDGTISYYRSGDDYLGNTTDGELVSFAPFTEEELGFTLGGPIIKDKLFFFVSYEDFETEDPFDFIDADADDGIDASFFSELNSVVQDVYGIDLQGRDQTGNAPFTSERITAKLDWNITDDHRAAVSYQRVREDELTSIGQSEFRSAYYNAPQELDAYNFEIFSNWTPQLSTEFRVNYKEFFRGQDCLAGTDVGELRFRFTEDELVGTQFEGLLDDGNPNSNVEYTFIGGCDRFRHANSFEDERLQFFGKADYVFGDHVLSVGGSYENYTLFNLFVERSLGRYTFNSPAELNDGTAFVEYRNALSNDANDAAAAWEYDLFSAFVQDEWQILSNLSVNAGFRYERFIQDDETPVRPDFEDQFGFSSVNSLDGLDIFQPRVGFRYEPFDRTIVSGGFGLFSGGNPQVWISNAYQPRAFFASGEFDNVDPTQVPQALLAEVGAGGGSDFVDLISDDFEIPSDWKASVRLDQSFDLEYDFLPFGLGTDYRFTTQLLYSQVNNGFRWENIAQTQDPDALPTGVAPDGRPIYADLQALGINNATALTNSDDGESLAFTVGLAKEYEAGFGFDASYAYQDVEQVTEGTSSRGISSWRGIADVDPNNPSAKTSPFQVEHAFKVNLSYETDLFGDLRSRFDVFGLIQSGDPFGYYFNVSSGNSLFGRAGNGESPFDNAPLYVPSVSGDGFSDPNVVFADGFDEGEFLDFINDRNIPTGGILNDRFDNSAWNQRWDFRYQQDLPGLFGAEQFVGENRFQFVVDIFNVANLLNDEWGTNFDGPRNNQSAIIGADLVSAADVAVNGVDGATALTGDLPRTTCLTEADCLYRFNFFDDRAASFRDRGDSVYQIRLGLRYEF